MSSIPSNNQHAAPKMCPVTGSYLLKQRPIHLFHDIKDIIKNSGVTLSESCSQELKQFLDEKLEPYSLPYGAKRPNLQANLDNIARLRDRRAQLKGQGATSESFPSANPDKRNGFNTNPRNVDESSMDVSSNVQTAPAVPTPRTLLKRARANETAKYDTMYRRRPFDEVANRVHPPYGFKEAPVASKRSTKAETFEHGPEDLNGSFYLHHNSPAFKKLLLQVDQSAYDKPSLIQECADDSLDVVEEEPIERAPPTITKNDLVKLEDGTDSNANGRSKLDPEVNSKPTPAPVIKIENATTTSAKRALDTFEEINPEAVSFTSDNLGAISNTRPAVNQTPPSVPAVKTKDVASGAQSSLSSFMSPGLQSSPSDVNQEVQDTPDTTYLDQSQQTLGRWQSPFSQTQGLPNSFSQSGFGSQSFLSPPGSVTSQTDGPVEINPRRSARLAQAQMTDSSSSAPPAPASSIPSPPPVISSSAPAVGVKRRRTASLADEVERVECQVRNKKVVTKEVVAKQREARRNEDSKATPRSSFKRARSVLDRRSL
ncbi:hypothetical protein J4E91_009296 [Alternaria rosae]|nr:hypothetical protein J4E91_009296 [Alternaria rosae]